MTMRIDDGSGVMSVSGFGELLRHYRVAVGLTQEELAERAGVSVRGISDLERGARGLPRKETLQLLLDALDLSPADRAALVAAARPPPATPARRGRGDRPPGLPAPLTPLIDREQEIMAVSALLAESANRLLTLTGPGGSGKTRVAIAVATRLTDAFTDGATFVGLAALTDPHLVVPTIAQTLDVREAAEQPLLRRLIAALRSSELLLVLDNCEHVLEAAPEIAALLEACPRLTVLATSRAPLRLSGEHEYPIPPLALPDEDGNEKRGAGCPMGEGRRGIEQSPAVRLFIVRAEAVAPDFALTEANRAMVAEIVRRLDGLPLAIELGAARVKLFPPAILLARMERRLPLLTGGPRDAPQRQRTLRDAIAWSYDLLAPDAQTLFRRLAVFTGGLTLEAAQAVAATSAPEPEVAEGLAALVDASLVGRTGDETDTEPRFSMLETVREFGLEALAASGEEARVRAAHAAYYLDLAEHAAWDLERGQAHRWLAILAVEQDNLRAALEWLEHAGEPEAFLRLARSLWVFWLFRGPYGEGRAWLERALVRGIDAPPSQRRQALFGVGLLAVNQGDVDRAETCFRESLAITQSQDDVEGTVYGWHGLGEVAMHRRQFSQATEHFAEALAWTHRLADRAWAGVNAGMALSHLGACAYAMNDLPLAASRFAEALSVQRVVGDRWGIGFSLAGVAFVARDQGQEERALTHLFEALTLFRDLGDRWMLAHVLEGLAGIAATWQPERAARLLGAAAALREASGLPVEPAYLASHERAAAATRAALGDAAFAAACSAGAGLSLERALAEATSVVPPRPVAAIATSSRQGTPFDLTPRELDVLRLLAEGRSDKEIGAALLISHRTVMIHVSRILAKLAVPSRALAAGEAARRGLL
jgi:predicted ATPase/DNA-binding CsgD family transcriptional regulator/DNA-binding XRE family transcriptional regulator